MACRGDHHVLFVCQWRLHLSLQCQPELAPEPVLRPARWFSGLEIHLTDCKVTATFARHDAGLFDKRFPFVITAYSFLPALL